MTQCISPQYMVYLETERTFLQPWSRISPRLSKNPQRLRELKQQSEVEGVQRDEQINRITQLHDFINSQPAEITEFDETLVRRMIEKITVYESYFEVTFKSGISVEIEG